MASIKWDPDSPRQTIQAAAVYGSEGPVRLRIATGGAGQTGFLKALCDEFITYYTFHKEPEPFQVEWIATDTSLSFNALASGAADIAIVYHSYAAKIAMQQGVAFHCEYAWRDHFMLVGPGTNPANLPTDQRCSVQDLFGLMFQAAVENPGIKFLSRYDKSANNIRESVIWSSIGIVPWSEPYSLWYHRYVALPAEALKAAAVLGEYTLVDRGTWFAADSEVRSALQIYKETSNPSRNDSLINPAILLVGTRAIDHGIAVAFAQWMRRSDGGQLVAASFELSGEKIHEPASNLTHPFDSMTGMTSRGS